VRCSQSASVRRPGVKGTVPLTTPPLSTCAYTSCVIRSMGHWCVCLSAWGRRGKARRGEERIGLPLLGVPRATSANSCGRTNASISTTAAQTYRLYQYQMNAVLILCAECFQRAAQPKPRRGWAAEPQSTGRALAHPLLSFAVVSLSLSVVLWRSAPSEAPLGNEPSSALLPCGQRQMQMGGLSVFVIPCRQPRGTRPPQYINGSSRGRTCP
jgi:hypothetical protein